MKDGWGPLLDGELRDEAVAAVQDIATALRKPQFTERIDDAAANASYRLGLASGRAGIALFHAYLAKTGLQPSARDIAEDFLDQAAAGPAEHVMNPALFAGFTGIAWAHAHVGDGSLVQRQRGDGSGLISEIPDKRRSHEKGQEERNERSEKGHG